MLPHNEDWVLQENTVSPGCPPQVLSQFVDSLPSSLVPLFPPHQSLPPSHLPLPSPTQIPPSSSTLFHQNYTTFGEKSSSPHSTSPSNYQLCLSPPLIQSSLSQLQNSSPHTCQPPTHLQNIHSSRITSPRHSSPSQEIQNTSSPGGKGGCVASKMDPALLKDPDAIIQTLVGHLGRRRITLDLQILFLQHMLQGTNGQAPDPVVAYPVCLVCLQPRTSACPITKYKTGPQLLAFPQLHAPAQESRPLRVGIGFGLRLPRGQAKALHLLPEKKQEGVESQGEALQSQKAAPQAPAVQTTGAHSQARSLRSADLQSPKSSQCPRPPPQAPRPATASLKPRPPPVPKRSILRKPS